MMMGSSEQAIKDMSEVVNDPSVINDFEEDIAQKLSTEYREEYLQKVANRVKSYEVKILNEPREGKKLLVLDIDYTLFDHRSTAETGRELMRPYLHEFLTTAYEVIGTYRYMNYNQLRSKIHRCIPNQSQMFYFQDYDIVIWSATNMKWIEEKMKVLGCDTHPGYKLSFYLDSRAMISIHADRYGVIEVSDIFLSCYMDA